ncbi:TonB-dependent receptor, partial [Undibacterium luofuense]|uniref:TonB-dependent receptor n=1 Tax=Undibacterium luofuense TaxID=2828733 RepID=UPI0030EB438B
VPERAVQSGLIDRYGSLDPSEGGDTQRIGLHVQRELVDSERRELWQAYRMQYRLNLYSNPTWYLNDPERGDQITQSEQRHITGGSWMRSQPLSNSLLPLTLETGFTTRYDQISPLALFSSRERNPLETRSLHRVNWWQGAAFAQVHAELHPQWRLSTGLRAEKVKADVQDLLNPLNSGLKTESAISPNLNITYQPSAGLALYLNAGRGFHSNDARGATLQPSVENGAERRPTPLMSAGKGWELGIRSAQWLNGLESSLVFWHLKTDSELTYVPDDASTEAGRPAKRYGWEMSHQYQINRHWWLELDAAWSHARYTDGSQNDNRVTDAPERTASMALRFEQGRWEWGLRGRYMGSRALTEDNSVRSRASVLWHGRVAYRFNRQITLSLDCLNLLNRRSHDMEYWYSSQMKQETVAVDDRHWHPATPRSVRAGVRWQW